MDRLARLHWVGRITYYIGWISALVAGLLHIARSGGVRMLNVTDRNFLEASFLLFVICMASEIRAAALARGNEMAGTVKRQAA